QATVAGWQVDPVKQVIAVAAVGQDRRRPAQAGQVAASGLYHFKGLGLLGLGGADVLRPSGVGVDRQPAAAEDVGVVGRLVLAAHADAVADSRKEGRVN